MELPWSRFQNGIDYMIIVTISNILYLHSIFIV